VPDGAPGVVTFAHGSGSSRHSPRNRSVAAALNQAGLGTLLFDLLTADEELDRANVFDVETLARRLTEATRLLRREERLPIGYFGASTGAAADVRSPTLLIVGGRDETVVDLNRQAQARMTCETRLAVVPGATHLFEEPGALDTVSDLAREWFLDHFKAHPER
jgi:predicted alpha/beta-hydrolase family hydrolase